MSENKKTLESLHAEYGQLCTKVGHLKYQIFTLSNGLVKMNEDLLALNAEKTSSDEKKRSDEELSNEYTKLCATAGHTQYQIFVLNEEVSLVNEELKKVNIEASEIQAEVKKAE